MPDPVEVEMAPLPPAGRTLLASAVWMTGSNLVAQAFAYGSLVLLARWLDPASFGTVAVGTSIVAIGVLFVDRGTWGAVIIKQRLTQRELGRAVRRCMTMALALAVAMAATSGIVVHHFATGGYPAALAAIALCLPLHALAVVPTALLQRAMHFRRLAATTGIANIVSALAAVGLARLGAGVWALVARQLLLFGLIAALSAVMCLPALRSHARGIARLGSVRSGVRIEWWFFMFAIAYAVTGSLDKLTVGVFGGAALVGLYSIATTVALAPWTQFSSQAGQVLFAAAASHPNSFSERTVQSARLMAMLMLPVLPVGILLAPAVLPGVLGPKWAPVVPVFQILLVVGVGNAIVNCIAEPLTGMGYMPFRTRIMIAQLAATLVALVILVPLAGIRGAAWAQLVVFVPYAAVYFTAGARRAGTSARALWVGMRPAIGSLALQIVVSSVVLFVLAWSGFPCGVAACWAAIAGLVVSVPVVVREAMRIRAS